MPDVNWALAMMILWKINEICSVLKGLFCKPRPITNTGYRFTTRGGKFLTCIVDHHPAPIFTCSWRSKKLKTISVDGHPFPTCRPGIKPQTFLKTRNLLKLIFTGLFRGLIPGRAGRKWWSRQRKWSSTFYSPKTVRWCWWSTMHLRTFLHRVVNRYPVSVIGLGLQNKSFNTGTNLFIFQRSSWLSPGVTSAFNQP